MKPYRSMVFRVRERFDLFRPVISARRVSDSGLDSAMIPSRARLPSDRTLVKLSVDVNHTFGSPAAGLYLPLAIAIVRAFICSKLAIPTRSVFIKLNDSLLYYEFVHLGAGILISPFQTLQGYRLLTLCNQPAVSDEPRRPDSAIK